MPPMRSRPVDPSPPAPTPIPPMLIPRAAFAATANADAVPPDRRRCPIEFPTAAAADADSTERQPGDAAARSDADPAEHDAAKLAAASDSDAANADAGDALTHADAEYAERDSVDRPRAGRGKSKREPVHRPGRRLVR